MCERVKHVRSHNYYIASGKYSLIIAQYGWQGSWPRVVSSSCVAIVLPAELHPNEIEEHHLVPVGKMMSMH